MKELQVHMMQHIAPDLFCLVIVPAHMLQLNNPISPTTQELTLIYNYDTYIVINNIACQLFAYCIGIHRCVPCTNLSPTITRIRPVVVRQRHNI
jgi:hypothetical protein